MKKIRQYSCKKDGKFLQIIYSTNIIGLICPLLSLPYPDLIHEILWLITNIAYGPKEMVLSLISNNILENIKIIITRSDDYLCIEQAFSCCANIAGEKTIKHILFEEKIDFVIMEFLTKRNAAELNVKIYKIIAFLLSNLIREASNYIDRINPFFDYAAQFLLLENEDLSYETLWIFYYFMDLGEDYIFKLINTGIITKIIKNLHLPNDRIKWVSIKILGIIAYKTNLSEILFKNNIYIFLNAVLDTDKSTLRKECLWLISNLTAEANEEGLSLFVESNLVQKIIKIIENDEFFIAKEGIYVFTNFVQSSSEFPDLIAKFAQKNGLYLILEQLDKFRSEKCECLINLLNALETFLCLGYQFNDYFKIFHDMYGIKILKDLFWHEDNKINEKSRKIYNEFVEFY